MLNQLSHPGTPVCLILNHKQRGVLWVAQLVKHLTLVQVMISQFISSSPTSGSVLTAQSLELLRILSLSLSLSLSAPPTHTGALSLLLSKINNKKILKITSREIT